MLKLSRGVKQGGVLSGCFNKNLILINSNILFLVKKSVILLFLNSIINCFLLLIVSNI